MPDRAERRSPRPRRVARRSGRLIALVAVAVLAAGSAVAATVTARVSPGAGSSHQVFLVSLRRPATTGGSGIITSHDTVSVGGPRGSGCVSGATEAMPDGSAGTTGEVALDPRRLGGHWCAGTFKGAVIQYERSHCGNPQNYAEHPAVICPMLVVAPRTIARLRFVVR